MLYIYYIHWHPLTGDMQVSTKYVIEYSKIQLLILTNYNNNWRLSCKKGDYIAFWGDFHFSQDPAHCRQTDLPRHEKHHSAITVFVDFCFVLEKWCMQKDLAFWTKNGRNLLLFYYSYNYTINAALLVQINKAWMGKIQVCFVVTPVEYKVGQFFPSFSTSLKNQNIY